MKKLLIVLVILIFGVPIAYGFTFNSEPYEDTFGDGNDFFACFYGNEMIPMPIPLDIVKVSITTGEDLTTGDALLFLGISMTQPPLPHQSYVIEVTVDIDTNPATGISKPECFYNGGGADYDFGVEINEGSIGSTWVDVYETGEWTRIGSVLTSLTEDGIDIQIPEEMLSTPINGGLSVHLISEGAIDSAPNRGESLIPIEFYYTPELKVVTPDVEEGSPFTLDLGISSSRYGEIVSYEWDLDNDGVYEMQSSESTFQHTYPDEGSYASLIKITDELGISTTGAVTVSVSNVPPSDLVVIHAGNSTDEAIVFNGFAVDQGNDEIAYTWDFGDGETGEGEEVTHTYDSPGTYTVVMTATDENGGETAHETMIDVIQPLTIVPLDPEGGGRKDVYVVGAAALILAGGAWYYARVVPQPDPEKEEEKEEPKKPGDFCEEHPEVVEQENDACWDAQIDLDSSVGDVQDNYDEAVPRWQSNTAEITRLITEWDTTVQMIKYWTGVEDEIEKDAETVQEVAGFVTNAAGKAKTAFKEGGEAAMKEIGEDLAKDVGKSVLGDISSTIGQVLELEGWAIREIGLGIAKGLTGVDPEQNAINLRDRSEQTFAGLCSWVSHSEAWNQGRRPPDTIQSCLESIQGMQNALDQAKQDFENVVKDFRCVMCEIPEHISEEIDSLEKNLEKWEKTFNKLKEEVEKRLEKAKELYKDKELYNSPYEYLDKAQDNIDRAKRALG